MGIDQIKKAVIFLSREEKSRLIEYIRETMSPDTLSGEDRYLYLVTIAEGVLKGTLTPRRTRKNTTIRMFVAYRLAEEGYGKTRIAEMMGRNHSTVIHLIRRMDDVLSLPRAYDEEVTRYREFVSAL